MKAGLTAPLASKQQHFFTACKCLLCYLIPVDENNVLATSGSFRLTLTRDEFIHAWTT